MGFVGAVAALGFFIVSSLSMWCDRSAVSVVLVLAVHGPLTVPVKWVMRSSMSPCLLGDAREHILNSDRTQRFALKSQLSRTANSGGPTHNSNRRREDGQEGQPMSPPSPSNTPILHVPNEKKDMHKKNALLSELHPPTVATARPLVIVMLPATPRQIGIPPPGVPTTPG